MDRNTRHGADEGNVRADPQGTGGHWDPVARLDLAAGGRMRIRLGTRDRHDPEGGGPARGR